MKEVGALVISQSDDQEIRLTYVGDSIIIKMMTSCKLCVFNTFIFVSSVFSALLKIRKFGRVVRRIVGRIIFLLLFQF